jgi:hypothetical protein
VANAAALFGPGRIIQQSAEQPIIVIEDAKEAEIRDLTLTRPEGKMETRKEGILAIKCRDLVIDNVRVIDNRSAAGAITLRESQNCRISRCLVRNYMRVSIDDRTKSGGLGLRLQLHRRHRHQRQLQHRNALIEGNRIIEDQPRPDAEVKAKHKLGDYREEERGQRAHRSASRPGTQATRTTGSRAAASSSPRRQ